MSCALWCSSKHRHSEAHRVLVLTVVAVVAALGASSSSADGTAFFKQSAPILNTVQPAPEQTVSWTRHETDGNPPGWAQATVSCGSLGTYYIGPSGSCEKDDPECRDETLVYYPEGSGSSTPASMPPPASIGLPKVALIDWPNAHGISVRNTILEIANNQVDVVFYDISQPPELTSLGLAAVTDAHLLAIGCNILETNETLPPSGREQIIHMSFGRPARQGEEDPCATDNPFMACEIWNVFHALGTLKTGIGLNKILPIGASGNYAGTEPLFPSICNNVLPIGGLNPNVFYESGEVVKSFETSQGCQGLFHGIGVCTTQSYALVGASTAAAVGTATMMGVINHATIQQPFSGLWYPSVETDPERFYLNHEYEVDTGKTSGTPPPLQVDRYEILSPGYAALLRRMRGLSSGDECWRPVTFGPEPLNLVRLYTDPRPAYSLAQMVSEQHKSSPWPDVCGACPGKPQEEDPPPPSGGGKSADIDTGNTILGFSMEGAVEPAGASLAAIHIRIGEGSNERFYEIEPEIVSPPWYLNAIMDGTLETLVVSVPDMSQWENESVSLVLTVQRDNCLLGEECLYWVSTPVLVLSEVESNGGEAPQ